MDPGSRFADNVPMERSQAPLVFVVVFVVMALSGCNFGSEDVPDPDTGIPWSLARERVRNISDVRYEIAFDLPAEAHVPITGRLTARFRLADASARLVFDFAPASDLDLLPGREFVETATSGGAELDFRVANGHVIIPAGELASGENEIELTFRAGDASLNRSTEFLYALFVPARAHTVFPCFDQPDLKARYALELTVPGDWQAVSNGAETSREDAGGKTRIRYAETPPISTYLFAFAAGRFQVEEAERNGRIFRMFHRETDADKVARNRDEVFDLHAAALQWLEDYTGIPYPFGKFDFALIPAFQYGGMEHPGAIFYRDGAMLLEESATQNQMLGRASTIAHETAHMWFGDLVTMEWFSDVWMKEVFANFMAAKIVNPSFPEVNHELRFLTAHYPSAYGIDRTEGTHPIRQELDNLNKAGSLYGAIIYQKAPIVMQQLERMIGEDAFRDGLRSYLEQFRFGTATWLDLVAAFDAQTVFDVATWSRAWVEERGRPVIRTALTLDDTGAVETLSFVQSDPEEGRSLVWAQQIEVLVGSGGEVRSFPLELHHERIDLPEAVRMARPDFVLPTGGGLAYGDVILDDASRIYLLEHLPDLADPLTRGAAWVTLWEEMVGRRVAPTELMDLALRALRREDTEQLVQLALGYVDTVYWRYLPPSEREALASRVENDLRAGIRRSASSSLKSAYFSAFRSVVTTPEGMALLEKVWRRQEQIPGLTLSEPDETSMAQQLAVWSHPEADAILAEQLERIENPDRKERFEFIMPTLSQNIEERQAFFASLGDPYNRRREPWVLEGLRNLNHPLRSAEAEVYVLPALNELREVQETGDIFFPRNWVGAVLSGHNSRSVASGVRRFLANQEDDYPVRLRRIILQAADSVFRAAEILEPGGD